MATLGEALFFFKGDRSDLNKSFDAAERDAESWSGNFGGKLAGGIKAGFLAAGAGVLAAIGGIVKGVAGNAEFEMYEAQFASLMGSTDDAKAKLEELSAFATTTPFELPDVIKSSKALLTFGGAALNTQENLDLVGNAAAASGAQVDEVAFWVGRAYNAIQNGQPFGEAASRLQELGILGGDARLKLEQLQKEGAKGPEVWAEFQQGLNAPTDAMQKLGGTWTGLMSTLSDTINGALRTITKPIFDALKAGLVPALAWLSGAEVQASIARFGESVGVAVNETIAFITAMIPTLVAGFNALKSGVDTVSGALSSFLASEIISNIMAMITQFASSIIAAFSGEGITSFTSTLASVSPAFAILLGAVQAALPPIQQIITSVFTIISGFMATHGAEIVGFMQTTWSQIRAIVDSVIPPIQLVISTIFGAIASFLSTHGAEIQSVLSTVWNTIKSVIELAVLAIQSIIVPVLGAIASFIGAHGAEIQALLSGAWTIIRSIIETVMGVIQGVIATVTAIIKGDWQGAWEAIKGIFSTVWDGITGILSGALEVIQGALSLAWDAISAATSLAWDGIKTVISGIWDGIKGAIDTVIQTIKDVLSGAWEVIKGVASGAWDAIKEAILGPLLAAYDAAKGIADTFVSIGEAIVGGMMGGMDSMFGSFKEKAKEAVRQAKEAAKAEADIKSPSRVWAAEIGRPLVEGAAAGIDAAVPLAERSAAQAIRDITGQAQTTQADPANRMLQPLPASGGQASAATPTIVINQYFDRGIDIAAVRELAHKGAEEAIRAMTTKANIRIQTQGKL